MNRQLTTFTIGIAALLSASAMFWGLRHMSWDTVDWSLLPVISGTALFVAGVCTLTSRSPAVICAGLSILLAVLAGAAGPSLTVLGIAASSWALGYRLSGKNEDVTSGWINAVLVGAGLFATAVSVSAHYPINYPGLYGVVLWLPVLLQPRLLAVIATSSVTRVRMHRKAGHEAQWWLEVCIGTMLLVHFVIGLMPEVGHDALAMHLFIPGHMANRHEWGFDVSKYAWAVMPMLGDWLYTIGYMFAGETAARLLNVGCILLITILIRDFALWCGASAVGARLAMLLFLTTPLTLTESSSLFIEAPWTAFVLAGSFTIFKLVYASGDARKHLLLSGFFLGAAVSAKAITLTVLLPLFVLLIFTCRKWWKASMTPAILLGAILFIMIGSLPYLSAWHLTGNPIFPFFNNIFHSPQWKGADFSAPGAFVNPLRWDTLYQATFDSQKFLEAPIRLGAPGFQWVALLIPGLVCLVWGRAKVPLTLAVVGLAAIIVVFHSTTYLRYIFPSLAMIAIVIGIACTKSANLRTSSPRIMVGICLLVTVMNVIFFKAATFYADLDMISLFSAQDREAHLRKVLPIRSAVDVVNSLNNSQLPVAVFASALTAGLRADALYPSWYNGNFSDAVAKSAGLQEMAELLSSYGVEYIILDDMWDTSAKREQIVAISEPITEGKTVNARLIKREFRFQTELLKNTEFIDESGWSFNPESKPMKTGGILATVSAPASQAVAVVSGRHYLYKAVVACPAQKAEGRLQVNWLDADSSFIATDIAVFQCDDRTESHTLEVTAPPKAATGMVYASSHRDVPVLFKQISFKK